MAGQSDHTVTGTWLGNYYYSRTADAHGFEAVFVQSGTQIEGSILDDGQLGEAHVAGSFSGSQLQFCKIYNSKARNPVKYEGTLSEDGKSIVGHWKISGDCHGSWRAWRLDDEKVPETEETNIEVEPVHKVATASSKK
jgi:hypothetical protein